MEPWGFPAEDMRLGVLASTMARAMGANVVPRDFMLGPALDGEDEEEAFGEEELDRMFGVG